VCKLLEANADKIGTWLDSVAEGDPEHGRAPDPARALDTLARLAEFAVPKLARVEGVGGASAQATAIKVNFVNAPSLTS
jgi:hypothetical protein